MIDVTGIKGQMQPWFYQNAKTHNTNLLTDEVKKEASIAEQQNQSFDFKAEYEKAAQKLGLFEPTGDIQLYSDIELSDRERAIFEKMDKDSTANGFHPMAVDDIAMNYHLDEMLANKGGFELPLNEAYFQRLMDDFDRPGSAVQAMGIDSSTIQYFMNNYSNYATSKYEANSGTYSEPSFNTKA